jgi:hypothetical protein
MANGLQGLFRAWRRAAGAGLLLTVVLLALSGVAVPQEMPASAADPGYNTIVADYLKGTFKNRATYDAYAISPFRWVHSSKAALWMVLARAAVVAGRLCE